MTVDLSVLESLGINLYSNAAAVLSELVANAYDADATRVDVNWKQDDRTIVVSDDGSGMTLEQINLRFLTVGYKKRLKEGSKSPTWSRPFMGRKGIGKLSVFSIAKEVTVYSSADGDAHGLRILVDDLQKKITKGEDYFPEDVEVPEEFQVEHGTALVLEDLKRGRADLTAAALRRRLARRFDVVDQTPREEGGFELWVNGDQITYADRQELKKLEFIWEFGPDRLPKAALPKGTKRFAFSSDVVDEDKDWKVSGWIGTARRPQELKKGEGDDGDESLRNVIVLARKRPIQEKILENLDFSRLFGEYVTGQVHADFLDLDEEGYDDIATSDRQRLIEDDPRVLKLQRFLREAFLEASETWAAERPKRHAKDVLEKHPKLKAWVEARPEWQQDAAHKMIGTIVSLNLEERETEGRLDLLRSGILAFERVGLRQVASDLDELSEMDSDKLLALLGAQDVYEAGLWVDILRSRIEAIQKFEDLTDVDVKEQVLQQHLFDHLWLLDPAWERATGSERMEEYLKEEAPEEFADDEETKQVKGRVDIRYSTVAGLHVIVELKRYSRRVSVEDLRDQGLKYVRALRSILKRQQRDTTNIEVVFVLGEEPRVDDLGVYDTEQAAIAGAFGQINGRHVRYDALIENARQQYEDYLQASRSAREVDEMLSSLTLDE